MTKAEAKPAADALFLQVVAITHRGRGRDHNEDSIGAGPWRGPADMGKPAVLRFRIGRGRAAAFVVADGLGGHPAGEVASQSVVERIASRSATLGQDLLAAAHHLTADVNEQLYAQMRASENLVGMGSTVAGLLCSSDQCVVFNIGDSRVYRWQDGYLHQISVDHVTPGRSGVAASLGGAPFFVKVNAHVASERWLLGRRYLLCSDGVSGVLTQETLETCMALPALDAVRALIRAVRAAGAPDDISMLLLERTAARPQSPAPKTGA